MKREEQKEEESRSEALLFFSGKVVEKGRRG